MKRILALLCTILALSTQSAVAGQVKSVSVSLNGEQLASQQLPLWCWAATIANLFAHHGYTVDQATIVSEVHGAPYNITGGDYSNLAKLLNRNWVDEYGDRFNSRLIAALDIPNGVTAISDDLIRDALRANRPIIMGTTNHAMLIVGMEYEESGGHVVKVLEVEVFDPLPGVGLRTASPLEVTPTFRGGQLLFLADSVIKSGSSASTRSTDTDSDTDSEPTEFGRSCQTAVGRCGPFYNQPPLPIGSPCHCVFPMGPVGGSVVK